MGKPRNTPKSAPASPLAPAPPAVPEARHTQLLGLLGGVFLVAFFLFPAAAFPQQGLLFTAIMLLTAAGLTVQTLRSGGPARAALISALGGVPALALLLYILWAALRWRQAEVPALGREWIVSLLALGVALVLGCGLGAMDRTRAHPAAAAPTVFTILTRVVILTALGLGLYAVYQYFIAYPRSYAELKGALTGPVADLQTQSLLDALLKRRVAGTLGNPNVFAAQLSVFIFISLSALARERDRRWRALAAASAAAAAGAVMLSASRGGLLTMAAALGWAAVLIFFQRRRPAPATLLALVLLLAASPAARAAGGSLMQRLGNIATIRERLFYWQIALKIWARHPLIGEGPGGFALRYLTLKDPVARESQYAHSWFFQTGAELGLIGVALLLLFWLGSAGRALARRRRGGLHPDAPWALGALLLLGFNGLFEFSLQWHAFLVAVGLLGGLVSGLTAPIQPTLPSPALRWRGAAGGVLAAAVGLLALVVTPVHDFVELHRWSAQTAARDGDAAAAIRSYTAALSLAPGDPALHLGLAWALDQTGAHPQAWRHMEEAARLNPRSAAVRDSQALWLDRQGRPDEALTKLGEALALYPSNVAYRLDRARLELRRNRPAEARADLQFIEKGALPVWEYQQDGYNDLRAAAGLARLPKDQIPK